MKAEFTAIIEKAPEGGFWAICPEVPGANGQGKTNSLEVPSNFFPGGTGIDTIMDNGVHIV